MKATDLVVEVRDANLNRVGQITARDLLGLELVLRFNAAGGWRVTLPAGNAMAEALRQPGAGIIVNGPDGVLLSGPMFSAKNVKSATDPAGQWEIAGYDDTVILGQRVAYPVPATADLAGQVLEHDVRAGFAETVLKGYVNANMGPSAPLERRVPGLIVETDLERGPVITGRARFDKLGELLSQLAIAGNLGFDIAQTGENLEFRVFQPLDRSAEVRMDVDNNRLERAEYSYTAPEATRVIVAGNGSGVDRVFLERSTVESLDAETLWSRRIEVFKDQRNTSDLAELEQAGDEILADKGKTVEAVSVTPSDGPAMAYPRDWGLGDRVSVVVGSDTISQVVTEVALVVGADGLRVAATVGDPAVAARGDVEAEVVTRQSDQEARISNLERNDTASGSVGATALAALTDVQLTTLQNGQALVYDQTAGVWKNADSSGAAVYASDSAPVAEPGALWIRTSDMSMFTRYSDGDSAQWVEVRKAEDLGLLNRVTTLEARPLSGLVPLVPTSVTVTGGTATTTANGKVTYTSATSISLNGVFSSASQKYLIAFECSANNTFEVRMRMRNAGTDRTGTNYHVAAWSVRDNATNAMVSSSSLVGSPIVATVAGGYFQTATVQVFNPFESDRETNWHFTSTSVTGSIWETRIGAGRYSVSQSNDSFTLIPSSTGTFSGTVQAFRYNE